MVPFVEFNMAQTTSVQALQGGSQSQWEPNSVKGPAVKAECKENPVQGKWQEAHHAENQDSRKTNSAESSQAQSQIPEDLQLGEDVLTPMAGRTYT